MGLGKEKTVLSHGIWLTLIVVTTITINVSPSYSQEPKKKGNAAWGSFIKDIKNLKKDVAADLNSRKMKKELKTEKKQVVDGFGGLFKAIKPPSVVTVEQVEVHKKTVAKNSKLIKKVKANSKPIKKDIYLIDTKKTTSGYSKEFEIVRKKLTHGQFDQLDPFYDQYYKSFREKYGEDQMGHLIRADKDLLRVYERASMYLYGGDFDQSINAFALSEELAYPKGTTYKLVLGAAKSGSAFAEMLSGIEELSPYEGASWELNAIYPFKIMAVSADGMIYLNRGIDGGLS